MRGLKFSTTGQILCALLLIMGVGLAAYSNNYQNGWHFDDQSYIVQNPTIRSLDNFHGIWNRLTAPARVVVLYSFALNYHFGQDNVWGYHVVNNAIHIIAALFVFGIAWTLLDTPRMRNDSLRKHRWLIALGAALFFVSHPLQTQAVTYICQRFASMATMFYLMAVFFYLKGRARSGYGWFIGAAVAAILGMFSKQIVMTLPITLLLCEWLFFGTFQIKDGMIKHWRKIVPLIAFLLIVPSLYSFRVTHILSIRHNSSGSYRGELIDRHSYPLTQLRVIPTYMRLLVLPINQNLLYDFQTSKSLWEPKTLAGLLLILTILGWGIMIRGRYPLVTFGILWFFVTLLVESSLIPIRHVIFEHRVYLPSVGFCFLLATIIALIVRNTRGAVTVVTVLVFVLATMTYERNKVWRDSITLWEDVKMKSPHKMRPYLNTGIARSNRGEFDAAIADFKIALEKVPNSIMALNNLGVTYTKLKRYDDALAVYDEALQINSKWEEVWNNRGDVYRHQQRYEDALANYDQALKLNPKMFRTYSNRGVVLAHLGQETRALADFSQSLAIAPGFVEAHQNRGNLYGRLRQYEEAIADFTIVIATNPKIPQVYNNRGNAYRRLQKFDLALADYDRAIELNPKFAEAYNNRGVIHRKLDQIEKAMQDYNIAIALNPGYVTAYNNRGNLYKTQGSFSAALSDFSTALQYEPENKIVYFNRAKTHLSRQDFQSALRDAEISRHLGYSQAGPFIDKLKQVIRVQP